MTPNDIRAAFIDELTLIALDIAPEGLGETDHIQEDQELDSTDVMYLVTALHQLLGLDITKPECPQISTLSRVVMFIAGKLAWIDLGCVGRSSSVVQSRRFVENPILA